MSAAESARHLMPFLYAVRVILHKSENEQQERGDGRKVRADIERGIEEMERKQSMTVQLAESMDKNVYSHAMMFTCHSHERDT